MNIQIHITLIAYALPVSPLIRSLGNADVTFHLYRHSNKPEVIADIDSILDDYNICYHPYGQNRGLAKSWNDGLVESQETGADVCALVNDDVEATWDDLAILARAAVNNRESGVIECQGFDGNMNRNQSMNFGFCAINPLAIEKIGYFDTNYWPIYGEDVDFSYRAGLAGVTFYNAGSTSVHHLGSATIKHDLDLKRQNDVTFPANEAYHARKWNGGYGHETYRLPFDSENFGWRISEEMRNAPYPGYNRTDLKEMAQS